VIVSSITVYPSIEANVSLAEISVTLSSETNRGEITYFGQEREEDKFDPD